MNLRPFNISVQGATHIKHKKECQDASYAYQDENSYIIAVADGHGGDDYVRSAIGSKLATEVAGKLIQEFLEANDVSQIRENPNEKLNTLQASIISKWKKVVNKHNEGTPFSDSEITNVSNKAKTDFLNGEKIETAYGTTLIAIGMTSKYWIGIHIGDGKCVAVNPTGKFLQPIPWDSKCFLNSTTSLCDINALDNFRNFFSEKLPIAIFIGTDGVDDCFGNNELLYNFYKTILYSFSSNDFNKAFSELEEYLPRLSAKGSGDDISLSAILNLDLIGEIEEVKDFDTEAEKARVKENEKIAKERIEHEKAMVDAKFEAEKAKALAKLELKNSVAEDNVCEKCNELILESANFCSMCGNKITNNVKIEDVLEIINSKEDDTNLTEKADKVSEDLQLALDDITVN